MLGGVVELQAAQDAPSFGGRTALAETLGVKTGPDIPTSVATYLEENADVWDQIVAKYDLRSRNCQLR
jgi:hypothetical protein